jgi:hypothetical protein
MEMVRMRIAEKKARAGILVVLFGESGKVRSFEEDRRVGTCFAMKSLERNKSQWAKVC